MVDKAFTALTALDSETAGPVVDVHPANSPHALILEALASELRKSDPDGTLVSRIADVGAYARRVAAQTIDVATGWSEVLGPVYDTDGVAEILGGGTPISRQAVSKRHLLALKTGSGRVVYPAFQFSETGSVIGGIADIVRTIDRTGVSRWTLAAWLVSPDAELGDRKPIEVMRSGGTDVVLAVVRSWADRVQ